MNVQRALFVAVGAILLAAVAFLILDGSAGSGTQGEAGDLLDDPGFEDVESLRGEPIEEAATNRIRWGGREDADSVARGPGFVSGLSGFRGRIVDANGAGVEAVQVAILRFDDEALLRPRSSLLGSEAHSPNWVAGRDTTAESGDFLITGVWPRSFYMLRAVADTGDRATLVVPRAPGPGEVVDLGDVSLRVGAVLTGTVVGSGGRPISGAVVRAARLPDSILDSWSLDRFDLQSPVLYSDGDRSQVFAVPEWVRRGFSELGVATSTTDDRGRFRMAVPGGRTAVLVTAHQRVSALRRGVEAVAGRETDLGSIELGRGAAIRGRVTDDRGRPIPGAEILVGQRTADHPVAFSARVGPSSVDGQFSARGFRPGFVVVAARRDQAAPWVVRDQLSAREEIVVRIPGNCDLTVGLVGPSGRDVGRPRFKLLSAAPETDIVDLNLLGFRPSLPLGGRVESLGAGRYRFRGLQHGRYTLLVEAEGCAVHVEQLALTESAERIIELKPQPRFDVWVTNAEGDPIADVSVAVQARGDLPRSPRLPVPCGHTDSEGRLQVQKSTTEKVAVRAVHPAYGSVERVVELPVAMVHIVLSPPGAIEGVLTDSGAVPDRGSWSLAVQRRGPRAGGEVFALPRLVQPGERGQFRVSGLAPGEYDVSVVAATQSQSLEQILDPRGLAQSYRQKSRTRVVPVHAGRTTRLDLDTQPANDYSGPTARVTGTVTVNGRAATGLEVRGWHKRWLLAPAGPDGRFDLGSVPVGSVGLFVLDPAVVRSGRWEMLWWKQVDVTSGAPVELHIDLRFGSVAGTVLHADGHAVPGCRVELTGAAKARDGKGLHTAVHGITDRQGRFVFERVPAGTYAVTVWNLSLGRRTRTGIVVSGGGVSDGIELRLERVARVAGRVAMDLLGRPGPQWAWLNLYGKDERGRYLSKEWGAKVRGDGSFVIKGVPPGRYEVFIGAMFRRAGPEPGWDTRMFVHDAILEVGNRGLRNVVLRPIPHRAKKKDKKKTATRARPSPAKK